MKIRNGFVSNSSSSSFVLLGNKITVRQLKNGEYNHTPMVLGEYCEGQQVFELTEEMIGAIVENLKTGNAFNYTIVDTIECGGEHFKLDTANLPETVEVFCTEADDWNPDLEDFKEMYLKG